MLKGFLAQNPQFHLLASVDYRSFGFRKAVPLEASVATWELVFSSHCKRIGIQTHCPHEDILEYNQPFDLLDRN